MVSLFRLLVLLLVFVTVRILFAVSRKWAMRVVLLSVLALYSVQLYMGLSQIVTEVIAGMPILVTGSYQNPGPYGCLISILECVLVACYALFETGSIERKVCSVMCVPGILILPLTQSRTAMLAFAVSMCLLAVCAYREKAVGILRRYGILILMGVLAAGITAYLFKKDSADGRMYMLRTSLVTMQRNGFRGVGRGRFGAAFAETQRIQFRKQIEAHGADALDWTVLNEKDRMAAESPAHAFNEYMYLGVEHGAAVMLLFMALIITAVVCSYSRKTVWCYGMTAFAIIAFFSYPLHSWITQIVFAVLAAACVADGGRMLKTSGLGALAVAQLALLIMVLVQLPLVRQKSRIEDAWKSVQQLHNMECYADVVERCESMMPYMNDNADFLYAYGQSLNKIGEYAKSDSILKLGTEVSGNPMLWNVMGNNSLALGRYDEAEKRYMQAFYTLPNRLYPLILLAKLQYARGDMEAFSDMQGRIESFMPKVESVRTELLRAEVRNLK
jgi:tetratricopeptide (TPR) repeat protein